MHLRARLLRLADDVQRADGLAAAEGNRVDLAIALDLHIHGRREGVDDRDADAVQAARDLVAVAAEFAARMQHRQDDLDGRLAALMHIHGDAAAVIDDRNAVILVNRDLDVVAIACERFIDGVVDDLIDQMVQAALRRGADVHARTLAHGLQTLENLDLISTVIGLDGGYLGAGLIRMDLHARRIEVLILELIHGRSGRFCRRQVDGLLFFLVCHIDLLIQSIPIQENRSFVIRARAAASAAAESGRISPNTRPVCPSR